MVKLKTDKNGKEYLIDLYDALIKNMQFDSEFFAISDIVDKMYSYDKELATKWTFSLIDNYGTKALHDYKMDWDEDANVRALVDNLIHSLRDNYKLDEIIKMIHDCVYLVQVRFFLWTHIFGPYKETNAFIKFFDEYIQSKKYDEAFGLVKMVVDNQGYIEEAVFDITSFLNLIIETYCNNKIEDQELLDFLYSLVDLVSSEHAKAFLKANFIDYLED